MTVATSMIILRYALRSWWKCSLSIFAAMLVSSCAVQETASPPPSLTGEGGPPSVRRLTEVQYRQSIADIFGAEIKIPGPFEPDIRRNGLLAVGTSEVAVTRAGFERYDALARNIAAQVTDKENRARLLGCVPENSTTADAACTTQVLKHYGRLLHRRPLDPERLAAYVQTAAAETRRLGDYYAGLSFALAGMLVAPEFLFRIDFAEPDPANPGRERLDGYSKASRLSFLLWNTTPDDALLAAAGRGELDSKSGLAAHVDRMLTSPRLTDGVRAFFSDLLEFEDIETVSKDGTIFPRFSRSVMNDAEEQTLRTITDHLISRNGDYRDLFTTRHTFMTRNLGIVYRVPVAAEEGWEPYEFSEDDGRAALENFDGLGQYRETENGSKIDTSGELDGYTYQDVTGLGEALRESPATVSCLVNNAYRYAAGRSVSNAEKQWLNWLEDNFAQNGYRLPNLLREIATSDTFFAVSTGGGDTNHAALSETGAD